MQSSNDNPSFHVSSWMAQLADTTPLYEVMMPGSHDAGMSELHHCAPPIGAEGSTKTQGGSVGDQLSWGSRYFDIRVDYDHNKLVTYHRTGPLGCNGQDLVDVLNEAVAFIQANPSEFALLKFSHIREYGDHHAKDTEAKINALLSEPQYQPYWYTNVNPQVSLATVTVGDLRGKLVMLYDYDQGVSPETGRFRYKDYTQPLPTATNIVVFDQYSDTDNYNTMAQDQVEKWTNYAGKGSAFLFLLSWTLTATKGPFSGSVEELAAKANANLPDVLDTQINTNQLPLPNIVYIDFMNATTAAAIIQYNFM